MNYERKIELVPLWHRSTLTLEEAVAYSGIGRNKLIELAEQKDCNFVIWSVAKDSSSAESSTSLLTRHILSEEVNSMEYEKKLELVPLWHKTALTLEEATAYCGIGKHKLAELADNPKCDFILWVGRKRLFKRKKLDDFIERSFSV